MSQQRPLWFGDWENPPPFIKALDEVRRLSTREGWCYKHVQAIQVAIDQYAEVPRKVEYIPLSWLVTPGNAPLQGEARGRGKREVRPVRQERTRSDAV